MSNMVDINLGMHEEERKSVAQKLSVLLANTYVVYLKTQNFHWNVTGPQFHSLHKMFEEQYKELADAIDEIAERIRTLGLPVQASFKAYSELATISESEGHPNAQEMIKQLLQDHEAISREIRDIISSLSDADDVASVDLVADRLGTHEKTAWMLRSSL